MTSSHTHDSRKVPWVRNKVDNKYPCVFILFMSVWVFVSSRMFSHLYIPVPKAQTLPCTCCTHTRSVRAWRCMFASPPSSTFTCLIVYCNTSSESQRTGIQRRSGGINYTTKTLVGLIRAVRSASLCQPPHQIRTLLWGSLITWSKKPDNEIYFRAETWRDQRRSAVFLPPFEMFR